MPAFFIAVYYLEASAEAAAAAFFALFAFLGFLALGAAASAGAAGADSEAAEVVAKAEAANRPAIRAAISFFIF